MSFEFFIATRYLKSKRKQSFISLVSLLSVLGVIIGVMALVIVIAVMSGVEESFRDRLLGLEPHIILLKYGNKLSNYREIKKEIKDNYDKKIKNITPFIYSQVMLRSANGSVGAFLRGIDPKTKNSIVEGFSREKLIETIPERDEINFKSKMIIGKGIAEELNVNVGDTVYVLTSKGTVSPIGHLPSMYRFEISGIFGTGFSEYDKALFYINISEASRILKMQYTSKNDIGYKNGSNKQTKMYVTGIGIWLKDIYDAKSISKDLATQYQFPYKLKTWHEMNRSLFTALKLEKTAMFIILILIIFVAAFNIASSLIMLVMEKTKDIAILKAMGATDKAIKKIFIINGLAIGLIGTVIGLFSGVFVCLILQRYKFIKLPDAYPFSTIPINLNFHDVLIIAVSTIAICFFASFYPATKASKLDPVEALRYG